MSLLSHHRPTLFLLVFCLAASAPFVSAQTLSVGVPDADAHLVRLAQTGYKINGASIAYDGKTLWLSMRKAPREVHDIYFCIKENNKWGQPVMQQTLSSDHNDWQPTVSADGQTIYFIREEMRNSGGKKEFLATNLYFSDLKPDGTWQTPQQMVISNGKDAQPIILPDNKTLCFSSRRDESDTEKRYFIRKLDKYNWTLPEDVPAGVKDERSLCNAFVTVTGTVSDLNTGKPQSAHIDVYDALTLRKLFDTRADADGTFRLALNQGLRYRLDAWQNSFSHDYNVLDITGLAADSAITWNPAVTKEINISIGTYDSDNMSKILPDLNLTEEGSTVRLLNAARKDADGTWKLRLAIGKDYVLHFHTPAYADTVFHIDTRREVRFADTQIDIQMHQQKIPVRFRIIDIETNEPVETAVTLVNRSQEEDPIVANMSGKGDILDLRCATMYHMQVNRVQYLYADTLFTLPSHTPVEPCEVTMALTPLKKESVVRLKNIEFEFNSYLLKDESFAELHQVAELLRKNPTLHIELSAHTDDVGSDAYNLRLSQQRGEQAAQYLIQEEGVDPARLTTVGYGESKPLVPNTSDENRAINRRVEFTIIDL